MTETTDLHSIFTNKANFKNFKSLNAYKDMVAHFDQEILQKDPVSYNNNRLVIIIIVLKYNFWIYTQLQYY